MKRVFKTIFAILLATIAISIQLLAVKPAQEKSQKANIEYINEEVSLLDQIDNQAYIIADTSDIKVRMSARRQLRKLMTQLDTKIYKVLADDAHIMLNTTDDHRKVVDACHQLMQQIRAIQADANVAQTAQQATIAINAVPDELKPTLIAAEAQKIQAAEEKAQQQGFLSRLKSRVFGDEVTWAKVGFYAAVGAAIAGLYYGYQYNENMYKKRFDLFNSSPEEIKRVWHLYDAWKEEDFKYHHAMSASLDKKQAQSQYFIEKKAYKAKRRARNIWQEYIDTFNKLSSDQKETLSNIRRSLGSWY